MQITRRDLLFAGLAVLLLPGCGGGGGTRTTTVNAATLALGLYPVIDEEISTEMGYPFVVALRNSQGNIVMEGSLYFTVNGQPYFDNGQVGDKSILSTIYASDIVAWQRL